MFENLDVEFVFLRTLVALPQFVLWNPNPVDSLAWFAIATNKLLRFTVQPAHSFYDTDLTLGIGRYSMVNRRRTIVYPHPVANFENRVGHATPSASWRSRTASTC